MNAYSEYRKYDVEIKVFGINFALTHHIYDVFRGIGFRQNCVELVDPLGGALESGCVVERGTPLLKKNQIGKYGRYTYCDITYCGWYPELVFLTEMFYNSTVSAELIPNTSIFDTLFGLQLRFSHSN